jgi:hypothetical protein
MGVSWTSAEPTAPPRDRSADPEASLAAHSPGTGQAPRRVMLVAAICIAVVAAAVFSALLVGSIGATEYGARADVLYDAPASAPLEARDRGLSTQRALIHSRAVLAPVAKDRNLPLKTVQNAVSVDLGTRNDLLSITAGLPDRIAALDLAAAVTASYLKLDAKVAAGARQDRGQLQDELDALTAQEQAAPARDAALLRERIRRIADVIVQTDGPPQAAPSVTRLHPRPPAVPAAGAPHRGGPDRRPRPRRRGGGAAGPSRLGAERLSAGAAP